MAAPPVPDETILETLTAYEANGRNQIRTAAAIGKSRSYVQEHLRQAARRGLMLNHPEAMPGFEITKVTTDPNGGQHITQKQEHGAPFEMPSTHLLGKMTVQRDAEGRVVQDWIRAEPQDYAREAAMRAVVDAFKEELPRAEPISMSLGGNADLLNQYTVTDLHFGMLSWGEETGADYDLKIAEKLLLDWFTAAIKMSPDAGTAVLAQLGDLLHHDAKVSVTPAHGHVLDADSRLQKMIRVAIRTLRRVIGMLLEKHDRVHVIMADANHDEAGGAWLREMFAVVYENEPRVTVDTSPNTYYALQHGQVALFYHHGHKKRFKDVDTVFAGRFREIYGSTKFAYGHTGHEHSDAAISTNLMKVEKHETLAAPDAYAANGGWLSGRSAKVITYHKRFGEVGRITLTPEMVQA